MPTDVRGKERADDHRVISGILHVLRSGCRWKDCPPEYGPHTTIYNRFARWAERGVWEHLFRELAGRGRSSATQMIDSTHIKAHRSASGGKGGEHKQAIGGSRGGRNTKIHALADARASSLKQESKGDSQGIGSLIQDAGWEVEASLDGKALFD